MNTITAFLDAHPDIKHALVGMLVAYVLANLAVWPPPQNPRYRAIWTLFVKTLIRGWDRYGGEWKLPGVVYPEPPPALPMPVTVPAPVPPALPATERITIPGEEESGPVTPPPDTTPSAQLPSVPLPSIPPPPPPPRLPTRIA